VNLKIKLGVISWCSYCDRGRSFTRVLLLTRVLAIDGGRCCSAREDERRKRKKMTCGACVSVIGGGASMKYMSLYTPAARPKSPPYIFFGILVGNEKI
jgi:hypothetical protein